MTRGAQSAVQIPTWPGSDFFFKSLRITIFLQNEKHIFVELPSKRVLPDITPYFSFLVFIERGWAQVHGAGAGAWLCFQNDWTTGVHSRTTFL